LLNLTLIEYAFDREEWSGQYLLGGICVDVTPRCRGDLYYIHSFAHLCHPSLDLSFAPQLLQSSFTTFHHTVLVIRLLDQHPAQRRAYLRQLAQDNLSTHLNLFAKLRILA
jgi:hypothetical protein